jgi:hypothetical protein
VVFSLVETGWKSRKRMLKPFVYKHKLQYHRVATCQAFKWAIRYINKYFQFTISRFADCTALDGICKPLDSRFLLHDRISIISFYEPKAAGMMPLTRTDWLFAIKIFKVIVT